MGLLGDFVANHATYSRTGSRAEQAATNHIAGHTANDRTGGCAFFLVSHASAATQAQSGDQKNGGQNRKALSEVHEISPGQ
jgi:hypothetical protein